MIWLALPRARMEDCSKRDTGGANAVAMVVTVFRFK